MLQATSRGAPAPTDGASRTSSDDDAFRTLTAADLERLTGRPRARWLALARSGAVPHTKAGRQVWFQRAAILAWLGAGGQALPGGWRREATTAPKPAQSNDIAGRRSRGRPRRVATV